MAAHSRLRFALAWLALALLAAGCASLPPLEGRSESHALTNVGQTGLGRAVESRLSAHPGASGFNPLRVATDAFAARGLLAVAAEKSIDAQYYIWQGDQTGFLLFEALWRAAGRGVRVRLLLDDANTGGEDATLAALAARPNVEVRLYNPFVRRDARALEFLTDFERLNRRMHNKAFVVDNTVAVVGGRNVGNEYFGAGTGVLFADVDVLGVGPVVREVSAAFDLYWNSASAYPASRLVGPPPANAAAQLEARFAAVRADPQSAVYLDALRTTPLVRTLLGGELPLDWAHAQVVRDDPAKTLDRSARSDVLLLTELLPAIGRPERSFDLVSPYFVPGDEGTAALVALAQRGVAVRVLTNSLAATDVTAVHGGYAKRRCELLRGGVRLFELKPTAAGSGGAPLRALGSGAHVGLHAKTFALDRERLFVGSFNFDPRSARLNTEMGIVIDSPPVAGQLSAALDDQISAVAYEVRVAEDGRCPEWIERTPAGEVRYDTEPGTRFAERAWIWFLGLLPIDWLL